MVLCIVGRGRLVAVYKITNLINKMVCGYVSVMQTLRPGELAVIIIWPNNVLCVIMVPSGNYAPLVGA